MSDELKVSSDLESQEARHPDADMKVELSFPKTKCTPIPGPTNKFWDTFGDEKQPGNLPETASNTY
jgi:hypothetical protein